MSDVARTTGRGFLVIVGAKAWFLLTGAVVNLGLPSFFDRFSDQGAAAFGDYNLVMNLVSILNMVMIAGTLQAVSKIVSEVPAQAGAVVRQSLRVQLLVGVPIAAAFALAAPLAAAAWRDPALAAPVRLSAGVVLMYSFYAVFVGYFNGTKRFTHQAGLDIGFATIKSLLILGAVLAGFGVDGAVAGFVVTSVVMTAAAAAWVWRVHARSAATEPNSAKSLGERVRKERIVGYMLAIMAYTLFLNGILRADLFLLKSLAASGFESLGLDAGAYTEASSRLSGVFSGMANIARLPYQAVIAITFVIFPVISQATFEGDREAARGYIRESLRYSTIFIVSLAAVVIADRATLVEALYPAEYASGGAALMWLALGMIGFALLYVASTILISAGRPVLAIALAAFTVALAAGLNAVLIPAGDVDDSMMNRAGLATCLAMAAGMAAAIGVLWQRFRAAVPPLTVLRTAVAGMAIVAVAPHVPIERLADALPGGRFALLGVIGLKMALFGLIFYALLIVMRELGPEDLARMKRVLGRKSRSKDA